MRKSLFLLAVLMLLILLVLAGCNLPAVLATATPTPEPTLTPKPTFFYASPTPTMIPFGSPKNPILISFVSETIDAKVKTNAEKVAEALSKATGFTIQSEVSPSYDFTLSGMRQGVVHMAWLPPLTYLYAKQQGFAQVALLTYHFGVFTYGVQFLANSDSQFKSFFDNTKNQSTANAATALKQFKGKRPCWVDPTSASGYLVPLGLFKQNNIEIQDGIFTQSHTNVVRTLYVKGVCDFGVTYTTFGDPRTASVVQKDLKDVLEQIPVLWVSDPIIPNLNLTYSTDLPEATQQTLTQALLALLKTPEGKSALIGATAYDISGLKIADDSDYADLLSLLDGMGIDLGSMIGK